jgi:cell division protein FtsW (lipid II flippase)
MDKKLLSVERLIGLTMILMGFLNILLSLQDDLGMAPVLMFLFGIILFVHSSVETWHKWGVIALAVAAGILFKAYEVDPVITYLYKQILFNGTILAAVIFMLTHPIKSRS